MGNNIRNQTLFYLQLEIEIAMTGICEFWVFCTIYDATVYNVYMFLN
jgi:hypothetical protein